MRNISFEVFNLQVERQRIYLISIFFFSLKKRYVFLIQRCIYFFYFNDSRVNSSMNKLCVYEITVSYRMKVYGLLKV